MIRLCLFHCGLGNDFHFDKVPFIIAVTVLIFFMSIENKIRRHYYLRYSLLWRTENDLFIENNKKRYLDILIQP